MPTSPLRRNRRTWLLRFIATLIGLGLSLVVAEGTLRLLDLAAVGGLATVTQQDFDRLPGIFMPGQKLVDREVRELPYRVTIDSLGYRGTGEFPRNKPAGHIRVILLGDSFTFGSLVNDDQTLPAQVEGLLRARCGTTVGVINAGVGGTSIETASAMAERSLPLGVDVAVLTFTENDVTDLANPMWTQLSANRAAKSRFPMSVVYPIARQTALWNLLLKARDVWRVRPVARGYADTLRSPAAAPDSRILALRAEYKARLAKLRDQLASANVQFLLGVFPSHLSVYGIGTGEQIRWVTQTALELGLTALDYTPALQRDGRPMEELYLLPRDGHPSPAGHGVVAPVLAEKLLTLPILAGRCDRRDRDAPAVVQGAAVGR